MVVRVWPGRLEQDRTARACRTSWPRRRARRRRPRAAWRRRRGSRRAPRSCGAARRPPCPARSWRTWSAGAAACRGCSWPATSVRSKTDISRSRAISALSLPRISWITSSMSRIASSRPSTRCSRSAALPRRKVERRRTTSKRWSRKTSSISLRPMRAGLAVDQGDRVDAEGLLHRRAPEELLEDRLGVEAVLDLDHQAQALGAVGEVLDVGDALQLLGLHELLDLLDHPLGADAVGQLGDDDALAPRGDVLDAGGGAHPEARRGRTRRRRARRRGR